MKIDSFLFLLTCLWWSAKTYSSLSYKILDVFWLWCFSISATRKNNWRIDGYKFQQHCYRIHKHHQHQYSISHSIQHWMSIQHREPGDKIYFGVPCANQTPWVQTHCDFFSLIWYQVSEQRTCFLIMCDVFKDMSSRKQIRKQ